MSAVELLLRGRARAEALMVDECVIWRRTGSLVTDPDTGVVSAVRTQIYAGKCKIQSKNSSTANPEAGERSFTVVTREVHIPANAADVRDSDEVEMTASLLNAFTVGKQYRVAGYTPDSFDTAARIPVKEVTS